MEEEIKNSTENQTEECIEETKEEFIEKPTEGSKEELSEEPTEESEEPIEESEESKEETIGESEAVMEALVEKRKKVLIGIAISLCTLLIIYFGMTRYFMDRFYFGTEIKGIHVAGKRVEEVKEIMTSELEDYTLTLKERGGKTEQIKSADVGLKYASDEKIQELKDGQNPYKWIIAGFTKKNTKMELEYLYDEKLLKERIDKLSCFESSNIIEPKNPSFKYADDQYIIVKEVPGNKIDKDILYSHVTDAIKNREKEIDLASQDCYIKPKYHSKSKKVIEVKDILNKYVSSKITYTFGEDKEILDGSRIHEWLVVNEDFEAVIDEEKVKEYVNELSQTYNTIGKTRDFGTSSGTTIKVGGGDYGWAIHREKEIETLIATIKEGKTVTKKPEYSQTAFSHGNNDIGDTYVEIDLTNQHIWFYKNGSLITHGDVVTGNVSKNHTTPKGIYRLKYKARDAVLRGPGYASPVDFWMPFNGGIGIHDASWRSIFGGTIYKTNGSHGCINSPYNVAKAIFNNIEPETPVICY